MNAVLRKPRDRSRREPLKSIFMVEAAQNRSRHDSPVARKIMTGDRRSGESGRRCRQARPEGGVRTAPVIMEPPGEQRSPQMRLPDRDQEVQALAQRSQESFTIAIRQGRPDRRAEDLDTHGRHGRIQPGRVEAVPIARDKPVSVGSARISRNVEGPGGGGGAVRRPGAGGDCQSQGRRRRQDPGTAVTTTQKSPPPRPGMIPDDGRPALPTGSGRFSSPATPAAHGPADRTR